MPLVYATKALAHVITIHCKLALGSLALQAPGFVIEKNKKTVVNNLLQRCTHADVFACTRHNALTRGAIVSDQIQNSVESRIVY